MLSVWLTAPGMGLECLLTHVRLCGELENPQQTGQSQLSPGLSGSHHTDCGVMGFKTPCSCIAWSDRDCLFARPPLNRPLTSPATLPLGTSTTRAACYRLSGHYWDWRPDNSPMPFHRQAFFNGGFSNHGAVSASSDRHCHVRVLAIDIAAAFDVTNISAIASIPV